MYMSVEQQRELDNLVDKGYELYLQLQELQLYEQFKIQQKIRLKPPKWCREFDAIEVRFDDKCNITEIVGQTQVDQFVVELPIKDAKLVDWCLDQTLPVLDYIKTHNIEDEIAAIQAELYRLQVNIDNIVNNEPVDY